MYINKAAAKACDEILKNGICQQVLLRTVQSKYSGSPHITDKHMRFSPPPANASGGYTLI